MHLDPLLGLCLALVLALYMHITAMDLYLELKHMDCGWFPYFCS
uniref:Uncharacterized protein n=1 Tax=Picea glauca TaxID=3330 RepID=A0A117NFK8_PICGL|nr:hypothetical protein ABT39_MTgene3421 [Picea glauca]